MSKDSLRIVVDNIDQKALTYLNTQGQAVVEGTTVTMYELRSKPSEVNSELTKRGYSVSELVRTSSNLEDYFFRVIGEHDSSTFAKGVGG